MIGTGSFPSLLQTFFQTRQSNLQSPFIELGPSGRLGYYVSQELFLEHV
jgi:hypothetical protein